jgi:hypothetical protein
MSQKLFSQDEKYLTKNAAEDLTSFRFVKLNSSNDANIDMADTAGEQVLGVTDNDVDYSEDPLARVVYEGITYVMAGGTVAADDYVTTDADGKAVKAGGVAAADYIAGKAMTAGDSGDLVAVHLFPAGGASIADVGAGHKLFVIPMAVVAATTVNDTGYNMPAKAVVKEAFIDVTTAPTAGTTKLVDVGFLNAGESGDEDGLLDGASIASIALVGPSLANAAVTRGALLRQDEDGSGAYVPSWDYSAGTRSITYTYSAADIAGQVANIVIDFIEVE